MIATVLALFLFGAQAETNSPSASPPPVKNELGRAFTVFDKDFFSSEEQKKKEAPGKSAYGYERSIEASDELMASDQMKLMQTCTISNEDSLQKRRDCYNAEKKKLKAKKKERMEAVERSQSLRGNGNPIKDFEERRKLSDEE